MDNAESSGQQRGRAISVRPAEDGLLVRSALRRRPTAGKRSIQAQSFERHLPFLICAARITLEPPPPPPPPLRGREKPPPPRPSPCGGGRDHPHPDPPPAGEGETTPTPTLPLRGRERPPPTPPLPLRGRERPPPPRPSPCGGGRNHPHPDPPPAGEGETSHRLLNSGLRFSLNAAMPSSASSDTNTRPIASRSMASPMSSGPP